MVERIANILNKEFGGLHGAAILLACSAFFSQILALLRDRLFASSFGASSQLDVYYAAFKIPDFLFVAVGSFLSITVVIPILVNKIKINVEDDQNEEARKFLSDLLTFFLLFFVLSSIVIFFFIPKASFFLAPGFDVGQRSEFIKLSRIMLLSPLFFGISSLIGSVSQVFKRFLVYALGPILYNFGIIFGIFFLYPIWGLSGLAYGVVLGALLHVLVQLPVAFRVKIVPFPSWRLNFKDIKYVVSRSIPRTVALGSNNIALMFIVAFASLIQDGSISVFNFAFNLQSVPLAIVGVSYSVAALPNLSYIYSSKKIDEFVSYVELALRHIIFWSIPATVLFIVLRAQIVRVVLGAGLFDWESTRLTAAALAMFSVSVASQSIINLLSMAYYSAGITKRPVVTRLFGSFLVILFSFLFFIPSDFNTALLSLIEKLLRVVGLSGTPILLLVLAFSLGNIANSIFLIFYFKRDFGTLFLSLSRTFFQVGISSVLLGITSYLFLNLYSRFIFKIETFWSIFGQGLFASIGGLIVAIIFLHLMNNQELGELRIALHKKFWKSKVIASPEKDI